MASADRQIVFRDPHTMAVQKRVPANCAGVNHADFSMNGRYFLISCEFDGQILKVDTAKKKIIGRLKGYHGITLASASLTGIPHNHRAFDLPLPGFFNTMNPHYYHGANPGESEEAFASRCAEELEKLIAGAPDRIAALEAKLADPALYARDPAAFQALSRDLDALRAAVAGGEEEWLALEEKRGALDSGR